MFKSEPAHSYAVDGGTVVAQAQLRSAGVSAGIEGLTNGTQARAHQPRASHLTKNLVHRAFATTPGRIRSLAALAAIALLAFWLYATQASQTWANATKRLRDVTGPALIASQEVSSSLAEADAAAISTFLSGTVEDKDQRAVYERALERVSHALEQSARLIGNDPVAHDDLSRTLSGVVRYAGMVEAARSARAGSLSSATTMLAAASKFLEEQVRPSIADLSTRSASALEHDRNTATGGRFGDVLSGAIATLLLLIVALYVANRTRRLLNVGVSLAILATAGVLLWGAVASRRQQQDVSDSLGATRAGVATIGTLRAAAYRLEGDRTRGLVAAGSSGTAPDLTADRVAIAGRDVSGSDVTSLRQGSGTDLVGLLGDVARIPSTGRQQAEAAEMLQRWSSYQATTRSSTATAAQANASFAGFNIAVDNVLSSQQDHFVRRLNQATQRLDSLEPSTAAGGLLALLFLASGVRRRTREYR